jgi:ATP-dependent DNA ligase
MRTPLRCADSTPQRPRPYHPAMLLRTRRPPPGFIEPCLPSPAERPPSGGEWIHEIKHDGYRMMVRRDVSGIRLLTRNGKDWTGRFASHSTMKHSKAANASPG